MYRIKRYANGRLYDTVEKKYITRDDLARLIDAGKEISIVDTKTGEDITRRIVPRIAARTGIPGGRKADPESDAYREEGLLDQFFKKGEDVLHDFRKRYESIRENIPEKPREEIDRLLNTLKQKKEEGEKRAGGLKDEFGRYRERLYDWLSGSIDRRLDDALRKMNLADREQIRELSETIDRLNEKIEKLEREVADKNKGGGA